MDHDYYFVGRQECDLLNQESIRKVIDKIKPDAVIHTAARVGGIGMNLSTPANQFYENVMMNTMLIHQCAMAGVKKLIAFSSVCAFPAKIECLKEEKLHKGEPFPDHLSYAYAKRMVDVQIEAYNKQYGLNYCSVIPGNIFGKRDNFNLKHGHVIPALIHRCYLAKQANIPFEVWGNGEPMREFIYSEDVARVCVQLIQKEKLPQRIIVSGEREYKIKEIVSIICKNFDYYNVRWLKDKPNGQMKRPSDKSIFNQFMKDFKYSDINETLSETINWFEKSYPEVRK
ncbi:MAG TPA: GDP-L-fucose synthase [Maribacter sp.]|nr:GDP-L-fucose synthase [Maribacter sp.]